MNYVFGYRYSSLRGDQSKNLMLKYQNRLLTLWKFDLKEGWRQARITGNEQGFLDVKREGIEKNVAQDAGCMQYADLMD